MPQTYRNYATVEVALAAFHKADFNEREHTRRGDIIDVRLPKAGIGDQEMHLFIWLRIYGEDVDVMRALMQPMDEVGIYDKRRFCIPFERLKAVYPAFDIQAARDTERVYQPFLLVDEETGRYVTNATTPLPMWGLVYDKLTRKYL